MVANSLQSGRVVSLGSINMDLVALCKNLPYPGQTVHGTSLEMIPGGKGANQAVAAVRAGAETVMIGAAGKDDAFGQQLADFLFNENIDISHVSSVEGVTGTALIAVEESGKILL